MLGYEMDMVGNAMDMSRTYWIHFGIIGFKVGFMLIARPIILYVC